MQCMTDRLETIHISQFQKHTVTESRAFEELAQEIERISPMALPSSRGDTNLKSILQKAARGRNFSIYVTGLPEYHNMAYPATKVAFSRAQQQFESHMMFQRGQAANVDQFPFVMGNRNPNAYRQNQWTARRNIKDWRKGPMVKHATPARVHFAGQGRYGVAPVKGTTFRRSRVSGRDGKRDEAMSKCFNFEEKDCNFRRCNKPLDFERIAKNKAAYYKKKYGSNANINMAEVLVDFAGEMHETLVADADSVEDNDDVQDYGDSEMGNTTDAYQDQPSAPTVHFSEGIALRLSNALEDDVSDDSDEAFQGEDGKADHPLPKG